MMEFRRNPRLYNDQINEVRPLRPLPVTPVKQKDQLLAGLCIHLLWLLRMV